MPEAPRIDDAHRRAHQAAVQELLLPSMTERRERGLWRVNANPAENLVGIGIGSKRVRGRRRAKVTAVQFFVAHKLPEHPIDERHRLPTSWHGHPTDVIQVGRFSATSGPQDQSRPALLGSSIGAISGIDSTYGTLGAVVRRTGQTSPRMVLSCNHVLSNWEQFTPQTTILQPAPVDGGTDPTASIARLSAVAPLVGAKRGRVDAAVAELGDPNAVRPAFPPDVAPLIDSTPAIAVERQKVHKVGRSTGVTRGEIMSAGAAFTVDSGDPDIGLILLEDQLLIRDLGRPFSDFGDSGSLVVATQERRALGLVCARSTGYSVANRITNVFTALGIELVVQVN